jgi:hypothetical protein
VRPLDATIEAFRDIVASRRFESQASKRTSEPTPCAGGEETSMGQGALRFFIAFQPDHGSSDPLFDLM